MRPRLASVVLATSLAASCALQAPVPPSFDATGQAKCRVAQSYRRPLTVDWPSSDRAALSALAARGTVAVRFVGCELEILSECTPPGRYEYVAVTPKADRLSVRDARDLYANLPLAAAELEAEVATGKEVAVSMTIVGRLELRDGPLLPASLGRGCQRATHLVQAITLGAFALDGARPSASTAAGLARSDGDAAACSGATDADAAPPSGCAAPLRLEVTPLAPEPAPVAAAGTRGPCARGMRYIPGGDTTIGAGEGSSNDGNTQPEHTVHVEPFCLDATEVTVAAYGACVGKRACTRAGESTGVYASSWRFGTCNGPRLARHPVNCIDFTQAQAYCRVQGKRLPTEIEWEHAAHGGDGRLMPWGNKLAYARGTDGLIILEVPSAAALLNVCGGECADEARRRDEYPARIFDESDGYLGTAPVGTYPAGASPAGVLDLAGNVSEWTASAYCPYDRYSCDNPQRVVRGSSFATSSVGDVHSTRRGGTDPMARSASIGFRCAASL